MKECLMSVIIPLRYWGEWVLNEKLLRFVKTDEVEFLLYHAEAKIAGKWTAGDCAYARDVDERVRIVDEGRALGAGVQGLQVAIAAAHGAYVSVADGDDWYVCYVLDALVDALKERWSEAPPMLRLVTWEAGLSKLYGAHIFECERDEESGIWEKHVDWFCLFAKDLLLAGPYEVKVALALWRAAPLVAMSWRGKSLKYERFRPCFSSWSPHKVATLVASLERNLLSWGREAPLELCGFPPLLVER